jgi:arginine decarboxylase-like protein
VRVQREEITAEQAERIVAEFAESLDGYTYLSFA